MHHCIALILFQFCKSWRICRQPLNDCHAALHTYAWQAINALTVLPHNRIGECPRCGWLFVDTSKGGRRRWCTMAVCGTSEKVRAHRERKSQ